MITRLTMSMPMSQNGVMVVVVVVVVQASLFSIYANLGRVVGTTIVSIAVALRPQ